MHTPTPPRAWTWADQISTYRFWGLVAAWVGVALGHWATRTALMESARATVRYTDLAMAMGVAQPVGMVCGVVLGLLLVRGHAVRWLLGAVLLCGLLLPWGLAGLEDGPTAWSMALTLGAAQALLYCWMLAVPAVLAGARSGAVALAAALAVAMLLKGAVDIAAPAAVMAWAERGPVLGYPAIGVVSAVLAALFLVPLLGRAGQALFSVPPPVRHHPLAPRNRQPWAVAAAVTLVWVAALVYARCAWQALSVGVEAVPAGWYALGHVCMAAGLLAWVRWSYRIHGEVALLAPSPELLTPRAAAWAAALMPLSGLLLPLQLAQVLNQAQPGRLSIRWLVLWCLLFPPVALALVQRAVNRVVAAQGRVPA